MGIMYDIVAPGNPKVYINTYRVLDEQAIDHFKDRDIVVITSRGEKYYRGKKMEE